MKNGGIKLSIQEMKDAGIGKYIPPRTPNYAAKKQAYVTERVWHYFSQAREKYRDIFTDATDWVDQDQANRAAQAEIDRLLFKRAGGAAVVFPGQPEEQIDSEEIEDGKLDKAVFNHCAKDVSPLDVVDYVFNNIGLKDPDPKDSPSAGAYFYLLHVQRSQENQTDFYKSIYAKTIPSKSVIEDSRKRNDDGRSNLELLERLASEMGSDAGDEISLLCGDLEIESADQDPQG